MGDPDRFRDGGETGLIEEGTHLLDDLVEHRGALRDDRGPDLHGACPGHEVLQGIKPRPDAADSDHWDADLFADVANPAHADRADGAADAATGVVRDDI